jgi:ABC-type lipoprotein release transport system permease subunit
LKLPFSLFLALRYLKPKRTFLSVITLISVLGVMLGVTVLILVISVMTGFDRELRQKVIDFDAHILVTTETTLTNWRELTEKIRATPQVVATAPFVQGPVIVEHDERRRTRRIRKPEDPNRFVDITGSVLLVNQGLNPDLPGLARALGLPDSSGSFFFVVEVSS